MRFRSLLALLLLCVLPSAYAADPPGSLYRVDITATRTGLSQPFQSTLYVEPRKEAVVEGPIQSDVQGETHSLSVRATLVTADEFKTATGRMP